MKRFGRIMFCFLPALLAFGLQQLISIPAVGLALLGGFYTKGATSIDDCMDAFLNIISSANFNAGVSAAYGTHLIFRLSSAFLLLQSAYSILPITLYLLLQPLTRTGWNITVTW